MRTGLTIVAPWDASRIISGYVRDEYGNRLQGVGVRLGGVVRRTSISCPPTDGTGRFLIERIPIGTDAVSLKETMRLVT